MNKELVYLLEPDVGRVTVEISQASMTEVNEIAQDLGVPVNMNCAKPATNLKHSPIIWPDHKSLAHQQASIWLYRLYHQSVVDGPGRRSVVQVSGCAIRCPGCHVPRTHKRENGKLTPIRLIEDAIEAQRDSHDGVTILGGEPFDQPDSVATLVTNLKRKKFHIVIYSGYTVDTLLSRKDPEVDSILAHADVLIDGPFVTQLSQGAGEYRGSLNQIVTPITNRVRASR